MSNVNKDKISRDNLLVLIESLPKLGGKSAKFLDIMELLLSYHSHIKGAPVPIPELIIFDGSKPKCIIRYDKKENEVKMITKKNFLQLPILMKFMLKEFRARKRPLNSDVTQKAFFNTQAQAITKMKSGSLASTKKDFSMNVNPRINNSRNLRCRLKEGRWRLFTITEKARRCWCQRRSSCAS